MNKLPINSPESFAYAVPGAGKAFHLEKDFFAFGRKYGTLDLWLKLTEESRHTYTDEDILIECKKRLTLPVVIRWQREIFDNLFFTLREKEPNIESALFYKRTVSSIYIENCFLDIRRKIELKEKSDHNAY